MLDKMLETLQAMMAANGSGAHAETFQALHESAQAVAGQMATMQEQMNGKDSEMASMQEAMASKESAMAEMMERATAAEAALTQAWTDRDEKIAAMEATMQATMETYKKAILAANPEVPEELVSGYNVDEVNASLEAAKAIVEKIKQHIDPTMPTGAPARGNIDTSHMSAKEKIRAGIG